MHILSCSSLAEPFFSDFTDFLECIKSQGREIDNEGRRERSDATRRIPSGFQFRRKISRNHVGRSVARPRRESPRVFAEKAARSPRSGGENRRATHAQTVPGMGQTRCKLKVPRVFWTVLRCAERLLRCAQAKSAALHCKSHVWARMGPLTEHESPPKSAGIGLCADQILPPSGRSGVDGTSGNTRLFFRPSARRHPVRRNPCGARAIRGGRSDIRQPPYLRMSPFPFLASMGV